MGEATSTIDDQLLLDFVAGSLPAAETLSTTAGPLLRKYARYAAPDLPRDLHDEVVSQSLEYLIDYGSQFRPERGKATTFLKVLTNQAARKVRADYCPPGYRTRLERSDRRRVRRGALSLSDVEIESPEAVDDLDTTCEVRAILRRAPVRIARALVLIYFAGETVSAAAKAVGMSRFALSREITGFMRTVQAAGAA